MTLDDVKAFYREHYTSENLQIGIAGDLPEGFAERVVEDFRKGLPSRKTETTPLPNPAAGRDST